MVDIKKTRTSNRFAITVLVVAACLSYVLATWRATEKQREETLNTPDAVILLDASGIGNSTQVDEWAEANGYELRRYANDADLTLAEDWAKMLVAKGKKHSPCVVVSLDGRVEVLPITDNLLDALKKQW